MITAIDFRILNLIQRKMRCGFLDFIMPKISLAGNFGAVWIFSALLLLASGRYEEFGEKILFGLILGVVFGNLILKNIFARPRPFIIDQAASLTIKAPKDSSFPSGHTLSSVISTAFLMHTNYVFGIAALTLCIMIIFSRMYLFVHYPSDVLGGIVLGILIFRCITPL